MVRIVFIVTFMISILFADAYENSCISCHKDLPVDLEKIFFNYLLKYSSESKVKSNLAAYLKNPTKEKSVMSKSFIKRFGVKKSTTLNDKELKKAIDIYWEKYKVFGRLK